jgi:hypothetical protein
VTCGLAPTNLFLQGIAVVGVPLVRRRVLARAAQVGGDLADRLDVCSMLVCHPSSVALMPGIEAAVVFSTTSVLSGNSSWAVARQRDRAGMSSQSSEPQDHESPRARVARERSAVRSRVANLRLAIVGTVAAATCGLAVFVGATVPGSSSASDRSAASGAVRSPVGGGSHGRGAELGGASAHAPGVSAPSASSGPSDVISGGS